jgi:flotillin
MFGFRVPAPDEAMLISGGNAGQIVDSLQIQSMDDLGAGYIDAMAAPHNAAIQRQTKIVQAQYKAEVDKAQAEAAQAGPLAQASAQREVIAAQTELAERQAELRQQQLVAEVVKPAEATGFQMILAAIDFERSMCAYAATPYGR